MESDKVIESFLNVKSWRRGDIRAPHKPLLLMYALSKFSQGITELTYVDVEKDLKQLLQDFGPPRNAYHPEYPFWRLQKDQIWKVSTSDKLEENSSGDVGTTALIDADAIGTIAKPIKNILNKNPELVHLLIAELLSAHFPTTIHEDILQAIGIDLTVSDDGALRKKRCPKFREKVLRVYEYRCAVCGFDVRLGHTPIALEAAHIKWHQAGGPDAEVNGLALCSLHHKLFDRGAFTLSGQLEILVSDRANGAESFTQWLMRYHGNKICCAQNKRYTPEFEFLSWHINEVFQGSYRDLN